MTPRNVDDIISERVAEMTSEERHAYEAELDAARQALVVGDMLRSLREQALPRRRRLGRWLAHRLRLRRRHIARIEARKTDLSLLHLTKAAHACGHCVTINVAPERTTDAAQDGSESDAAAFVFVSSSMRPGRFDPPSITAGHARARLADESQPY